MTAPLYYCVHISVQHPIRSITPYVVSRTRTLDFDFFFFFTSTVAGALMLTVHHVDGKMKCVSKMFARRVFIISSLPGITNDGLDCSF